MFVENEWHARGWMISEDIPRTGNWEEALLVHTPLSRPPADGCVGKGHFLIEAPWCEVWSLVLLESDMQPGPEISADNVTSLRQASQHKTQSPKILPTQVR